MKRSVFFLVFLIIIIDVNCIKPVGYIRNASYVSNNTKVILSYINTCSECICNAFFSSASSVYVGLNCYQSNKTCELFANYSTSSTVTMNLDSTFIFIQQPPLQNKTTVPALLNGVTVAGYGNGIAGNTNNALTNPWGLAVNADESFYVADYNNYRVMKIQPGSLMGSRVAGTGAQGTSANKLTYPTEIAIDAHSNLYINDDFGYRVMLWYNNSSSGVRVAGTGSAGNTTSTVGESIGLAVDSQGNIYVGDKGNHRVMKWAPNATSGVLVAGTSGVAGTSNRYLNNPYGLFLDETNSYLYIADWANNRIQRYSLGNPTNGTTVAGGHGYGAGNNQLQNPYGMCVSKKTGDIYIADKQNHRIQRWSSGATSGVTIIGITGVCGTNATMLCSPANVVLNKNETYLYVTDMDNHRVQRYTLT